MSPLSRVLAVPIVLLGVAAAVALPNGYTCGEGTVLEVHRQWSFGQERWFYGCYLPPELIQSQGGTEFHPFHPMDAMADRRIPLRIGAVLAGLVLARAVLFVVERMATGGPSDNQLPRPTAGTGILVAVSTLLGAAIAVLVTLRREEYWVRAADGSGFPTRSILGWERHRSWLRWPSRSSEQQEARFSACSFSGCTDASDPTWR